MTANSVDLRSFPYAVSWNNRRLIPAASMLVIVMEASALALSLKDMVTKLRDGGLPIAAIAEVVKVERKTVYGWLDGVEPRELHAKRIETLYRLLGKYGTDLRSLYRVWNRNLEHGFSIRHFLTAEPISELSVEAALDHLRLAMERHSARDVARRSPRKGARNPVIDEMPVASMAK